MRLKIKNTNSKTFGTALSNYQQAFHKKRAAEAAQGGYCKSKVDQFDQGVEPVFITTGAGPCVIVVVQGANGTGALGHVDNQLSIISVTKKMIDAVRTVSSQIDSVVFASGVGCKQDEVVSQIGKYIGNEDDVLWASSGGTSYSCCLYLPKSFLVVFGEDFDMSKVNKNYPYETDEKDIEQGSTEFSSSV
jgi:hypothetical protein